jgi:hypothetical protein
VDPFLVSGDFETFAGVDAPGVALSARGPIWRRSNEVMKDGARGLACD